MQPVVFENVQYVYGNEERTKALNGTSFAVRQGSFTVLLGRNGSGKSTAAKMMNALFCPTAGTVTVFGMDVSQEKNKFSVRKRAGMVFQNPDNQTVATVVEDDIAFGPENLGVPREEIGNRITQALAAVDMQSFRNATVSRLSGGQKQRVAIAGVLALAPDLLILDESTAMLDPVGRREVLAAAKRLNRERGITVVLITHFMEEAAMADAVIVMDDGKVAMQGTPKEVFSRRETLRDLGIELPRPMLLAEELRNRGIPLPEGIMTKEELAEELCKFAQKD